MWVYVCVCCCYSFIRPYWIILIFVFIVCKRLSTHTKRTSIKCDDCTWERERAIQWARKRANEKKTRRKALEPEMCNDETGKQRTKKNKELKFTGITFLHIPRHGTMNGFDMSARMCSFDINEWFRMYFSLFECSIQHRRNRHNDMYTRNYK